MNLLKLTNNPEKRKKSDAATTQCWNINKKISLQNCQPNELYQNFYFLSIDKNVGLKLDIFAGFSNTVWCWMTTFIYRGAHTMYWYFGCAWAWVFHKYKKRNCQRTFLAFLFYITTDSVCFNSTLFLYNF